MAFSFRAERRPRCSAGRLACALSQGATVGGSPPITVTSEESWARATRQTRKIRLVDAQARRLLQQQLGLRRRSPWRRRAARAAGGVRSLEVAVAAGLQGVRLRISQARQGGIGPGREEVSR